MAELKFDGLHVDQYKARQVALDNKKEYRLDYDETFALVVKINCSDSYCSYNYWAA